MSFIINTNVDFIGNFNLKGIFTSFYDRFVMQNFYGFYAREIEKN